MFYLHDRLSNCSIFADEHTQQERDQSHAQLPLVACEHCSQGKVMPGGHPFSWYREMCWGCVSIWTLRFVRENHSHGSQKVAIKICPALIDSSFLFSRIALPHLFRCVRQDFRWTSFIFSNRPVQAKIKQQSKHQLNHGRGLRLRANGGKIVRPNR